MGFARSTYYDELKGQPIEEERLMTQIAEICAEFPRYGYRRITAQLREDGIIVNHKKVMAYEGAWPYRAAAAALCGHHRQRS